jgi:hypothetical protein
VRGPVPVLPRHREAIGPQITEHLAGQPDDDDQDHHGGEQIGGHREGLARLADAAQVAVAHDQDDADRDDGQHVRVAELRDSGDGRGHRRGARGDLHRHRDHVVDEQGNGGDLGHPGAEVVPGHHVGAAGPGVDGDHLAVGQHDQGHHEQHDAGQRQDQRERGDEQAALEQLDEDFLGAVGRGGDPVRGQHTERQHVGQPLLTESLVDHGRAEQAALHRVPEGLPLAAAAREKPDCLA